MSAVLTFTPGGRMLVRRMLVASALVLAASAPLTAQSTQEWFGLDNRPSSFIGSYGGESFYVGAYLGYDLGTGVTAESSGPSLDLYCVDFYHEATAGTNWRAYVTSLTSGLDGYSWLGSAGRDRYERAAWLTTKFAGLTTSQDVLAVHLAIWHIMDDRFSLAYPSVSLGVSAKAQGYVDLAAASYNTDTNIDYSDFAVVHATNPENFQEYLIQRPSTAPEPPQVLLLGLGMLGLGLVVVLRRGLEA